MHFLFLFLSFLKTSHIPFLFHFHFIFPSLIGSVIWIVVFETDAILCNDLLAVEFEFEVLAFTFSLKFIGSCFLVHCCFALSAEELNLLELAGWIFLNCNRVLFWEVYCAFVAGANSFKGVTSKDMGFFCPCELAGIAFCTKW